MPKRTATGELNHENWDVEDESEERGHFQTADLSTIKERSIKIAKRRALNSEENKGTGNLFKSFTGFVAPSTSSTMSFNFGQKSAGELPASKQTGSSNTDDSKTLNRAKHMKSLKSLNLSVLKWIEEHINKDPYCVLSPIFVDYDKHVETIEKKYPLDDESESTSSNPMSQASTAPKITSSDKTSLPFSFTKSDTNQKSFSFPVISSTSNSSEKSLPFAFSFSANSSSTQPSTTSTDGISRPMFSFTGSGTSVTTNNNNSCLTNTTASSTLFSFGNLPKPVTAGLPTFSFANGDPTTPSTSSSQPTNNEDCDDNDEYVPPKPEVREIHEENSVYSIRCKLFYKFDNEWKEKGIGNVFIKPMESGKFQLLMRADTNLGNILLNIMVTKDMPFKTMKNNVSFLCIPSPPLIRDKEEVKTPVAMLLRVKTEAAAEMFLSEINKHRGM